MEIRKWKSNDSELIVNAWSLKTWPSLNFNFYLQALTTEIIKHSHTLREALTFYIGCSTLSWQFFTQKKLRQPCWGTGLIMLVTNMNVDFQHFDTCWITGKCQYYWRLELMFTAKWQYTSNLHVEHYLTEKWQYY